MPGIEKEQLLESMHYASRISINLEAPNDHRLSLLAPKKTFQSELIEPIKWAAEIRHTKSPNRTWNGRWPSGATQFVIGAVGESDLELISTSEQLFNNYKLRRVYYSRFNPIENTPLEDHPPEDPIRKNRLYQASYLLRDYQFSLEDMPFNQQGFLPKDTDPKRFPGSAQGHQTLS
jgi:predicted DNA-binding helix-hairpin-helix protein